MPKWQNRLSVPSKLTYELLLISPMIRAHMRRMRTILATSNPHMICTSNPFCDSVTMLYAVVSQLCGTIGCYVTIAEFSGEVSL